MQKLRSWKIGWVVWAALAWSMAHPAIAQKLATNFVAPSTRRMAERLDQIIRETDPSENGFMNRERALMVGQLLAGVTNAVTRLNLQGSFAIELLNAGQTAEAIREFQTLEELYKAGEKTGTMTRPENFALLRRFQAIAYLRQGEQDNCLSNHTSQSCLLPIQGGGIHQNQRGSRAAVKILTEQLTKNPGDQSALWLLNIAYMTLGEYPERVPAQWRIDPKVFESEYDIKKFPEIASSLGLDVDGLAGGSIAEDFDGDGYLDIMVSTMALRGELRLFHNNADGTFSDRSAQMGLAGITGGLNIVQTDYNNDGFADVLVLRGGWMAEAGRFPNSLLRNNKNGTFTDVTEEAGLLSFHPTQTAVWFDYDNDGWLDLFIGNESLGEGVHPCELYHNNRNGTFTECAAQAGVAAVGLVKGVAGGDFDNDGRPDLYVSRRGQSNILYRNDGAASGDKTGSWRFTDVSESAGVTEPKASFPTWFFDYDNDGWLDIFVSGYGLASLGDIVADYNRQPHRSECARLYRNNHDGTFTDVSKSAGVFRLLHAMGANYGDLDNDGYLDFYLGTGDPNLGTLIPNRMLRNSGGKLFQDVTSSGGFGHLQKGHGVSFADLDNDGDQDIHTVIGGAYSGDNYRNALFENPGHGNHWITIKLEGVKSNRAAIGARLKVTVATEHGDKTIYKTVSTGGSFGASPLRQEIGLGQAKAIRAVEIFWPVTGQTQSFSGLKMDQFYRLREGDPALAQIELKRFKLASSASGMKPHQHVHAE